MPPFKSSRLEAEALGLTRLGSRARSGDSRPTLGVALGGGAARGWAHVGVLRALLDAGLSPDIVAGTSIGALVGAAYAASELDRFESWLRSLGWMDVVGLMDVGLSGGLLKGERLMAFFEREFTDRPIAELGKPFGAVATDLRTGTEVWLREGSVSQAVRASIALPGLLTPVVLGDQMLVDGGLVNPVPVSLARAMGADIVLAVDLNSDLVGRRFRPKAASTGPVSNMSDWHEDIPQRISSRLTQLFRPDGEPLASVFDVVASSINIMQVRITRSRMAGEPPDFTVSPRVADIGLLEFHRAAEAIEAGHRATRHVIAALAESLGRSVA